MVMMILTMTKMIIMMMAMMFKTAMTMLMPGARDTRGKRWKQDGVWIQEGEKREVGCLR